MLNEGEELLVGKVLYDDERKERLISSLARRAEEFLPDEEKEARGAFRQVVGELSPFMKGSSYQDESEWRIFRLAFGGGPPHETIFRHGGGIVTPYLEASIQGPEDGEDPVPVQIHAGPGLTPAIHGETLRLLTGAARFENSNSAPPELRWVTNRDLR